MASEKEMYEIIGRAVADKTFREMLIADPEKAAAARAACDGGRIAALPAFPRAGAYGDADTAAGYGDNPFVEGLFTGHRFVYGVYRSDVGNHGTDFNGECS